ncbi:RHS repeat-associated core domain-containing protein, partial [Corallococcus carmarthensis]
MARTRGQRLSVPPDTLLPTETVDGFVAGTLKGQAGVSSDGSATYSLPLWVTPGRAGMQPSLSLQYKSSHPDGLLGVGWSVSGLSQITRCPRTVAQDGFSQPVTFTAADAFCLDGQRLVAVSGAYGASNTEYRTELDGFSKVVSLDADANGPASFRVYTKNGRILTYGGGNATFKGARISVRPAFEKSYFTTRDAEVNRYAWSLAQVADRVGNAMLFDYALNYDAYDSSYEQLLLRIRYTAMLDGTQQPRRTVEFGYGTRPLDNRTVYVAGFKMKMSRRLSLLRMWGPDESGLPVVLKSYSLSYTDEVGSGRSLLTSLQECDGSSRCKRPMSFEWTPQVNTFTPVDPAMSDANITAAFASLQPGDIDGDGRDDLIYRANATSSSFHWRVRTSDGTSFNAPTVTALPTSCWANTEGEDGRWYDVDLDGRLDVSMVQKDGCSLTPPRTLMNYRGGMSGFSLVDTDQARKTFMADLDGNGLMEAVQINYANPNGQGLPRLSFRENLQGVLQPYQQITFQPDDYNDNIYFTLNQDGTSQTSLLMENKRQLPAGYVEPVSDRFWSVQKRNGAFVKTETTLLLPHVDQKAYLFADINGDGLPDAIMSPGEGGDIEIMMNTGNGFAAPVTQVLPAFAKLTSWEFDNGVRVLDFNHDGRQDLLLMGKRGTDRTHFVVMLSNGSTFGAGVRWDLPVSADAETRHYQLSKIFDMNGDGLMDLTQPENGRLMVYRRDGQRPGMLTAVRDGLNSSTTFSYKPISEPTVHARGTTCGYPNTCARDSVWVVSESQTDMGEASPTGIKRYFYEDGRIDVTGRGWLGFSAMTVTDVRDFTVTRTEYGTKTRVGTFYPYASTPLRERTQLQLAGRTTERERVITYRSTLRSGTEPNTKVLAMFPLSGTETEREFATASGPGTGFVRVTDTSWFHDDTYGNLLEKTQTTHGGDQVAWQAEYSNSPSDWLVGLPTNVRETSIVNGQTIIRSKALGYEAATGYLQSETLMPGDPALEQTTTFTRSPDGLATQLTRTAGGGLLSRTTLITYDGFDRVFPASLTNAVGHTTEYAYHPGLGVLAASRDELGVVTTWQYDRFGRMRKEDAPDLSDTEVHYTQFLVNGAYRFQVSTAVAGSRTVTVDYDRLGRSVKTTSQDFNGAPVISERRYDWHGRVSQVIEPNPMGGTDGVVTAWEYDPLGRVVKVTKPDGSFSTSSYLDFPQGLLTTVTDTNGNARRFLNDVNGRVIRSSERKSTTAGWLDTNYEYGPFGLLVKARDPLGHITQIGYDATGRRTSFQDPDSGLVTTHYTAFGEMDWTVDASNVLTTYSRDSLGRPLTIHSSRDGTSQLTWDVLGQGPAVPGRLMRSFREGDAQTSLDDIFVDYTYDSLGRPTREQWSVEGRPYAIDRSYDGHGRLQALEYPAVAGARLTLGYEYTARGDLQTVRDLDTLGERWRVVDRNAVGQLLSETLGNGVVTQRLYDSMGRLRFIQTQKGTTGLQQLAYEYDGVGNILGRHDRLANTSEEFHYDGLDRLTDWSISQNCRSIGQTYAYDDLGNLLGWTSSLGTSQTQSFTYGVGGAGPHALTGSQAGSYGYDASGNQTSAPGRTVEFTGFGLPSRITDGQQSVTYRYTAGNTRAVKRHSDGTVTTYVGGIYEERREPGGGVTHAFHVGAAGRAIAQVVWRVDADPSKPLKKTWNYLHPDHQGSTESVTDASGKLVGRMKYDPFGGRRHPLDLSVPWQGTPQEVSRGFTGHEQDVEFDLVNMRGRIYDPKIGRFLSPDPVIQAPLMGQSFNRYSYVLNNPLRYTDPSGYMSIDAIYYYDAWYGMEVGRVPGEWTAPDTRYPAQGLGPGLFERAPNFDPIKPFELNFGAGTRSEEYDYLRDRTYGDDSTTENIQAVLKVTYHPDEVDLLLMRLKYGLQGGLMGVTAGLLPAGSLLPLPEDKSEDFYTGYGLGLGLVSVSELVDAVYMLALGGVGEAGGGGLTLT